MIELERVRKTYGSAVAVDDLSLSIGDGEFWALVGPSGCGKSTTLKMINRLVPMSSGTIRLNGEDIAALPVETLRRRIGYAIQSAGLFPHWTVEKNIATVPRLLEWPEAQVRERVVALMDLVGLDRETYRAKYPDQLSGGEQQRVGVARALAADPATLLMDEPFGALDPITRDGLQGELARIHRTTGKTIVMVTHDMDEALRLASHVAVMRAGKIVQAGSPLEILGSPASDFVRDFVGGSRIGLALLSLRRIADLVRPDLAGAGEPIDAAASLRDALFEMLGRRVDRLAVRGADGGLIGAVMLADLVA